MVCYSATRPLVVGHLSAHLGGRQRLTPCQLLLIFLKGNLSVGHSSFVAWSGKHCSGCFCLLDTIISWLGLWDTTRCPVDKNTPKLRCPVDHATKLRCHRQKHPGQCLPDQATNEACPTDKFPFSKCMPIAPTEHVWYTQLCHLVTGRCEMTYYIMLKNMSATSRIRRSGKFCNKKIKIS
jgi:hypothetical protein